MTGRVIAATNESVAPVGSSSLSTPFGKLDFSGAFDLYYAHNFNNVGAYAGQVPGGGSLGPNTPLIQTPYRLYDVYSNQFALNLAELAVGLSGEQADLHLQFDYGQSTDLRHAFLGGTDAVSKYIGQAYATYHPTAIRGLRISAGKMDSHVGLESFRAKDNLNYSHSFLYTFGLPYWDVGLDVSYVLWPGVMLLGVSVTNGWNTAYAINGGKSYGVHLGLMPFNGLQLYYNGAFGPQQVGRLDATRALHEFNLTYVADTDFLVQADVLLGSGNNEALPGGGFGSASWKSAWLGVKIGFPPWIFFAPRLEFFRDSGGALTGADQMLYAETITAGLTFTTALELRLEFRHDHSDQTPFVDKGGIPDSSQNTVSAAFLYSF